MLKLLWIFHLYKSAVILGHFELHFKYSVPPMKQDAQIHLVGLTVANEVPLDLGAGILQLRVQRLLH